MADKERIIVDGVDVSGCYQYMPRYMEDYDIDTLDYCRYHFKPCKDVDVKHCYYKQLKRKEQECEELKSDLTELSKIIDCKNGTILTFKAKLDQLKKNNEELRKCYKNNSALLDFEETNTTKLVNKVMKLEQTFIEIKEIAEENIRIADLEGLNGVYRRGLAEQILQKIREV